MSDNEQQFHFVFDKLERDPYRNRIDFSCRQLLDSHRSALEYSWLAELEVQQQNRPFHCRLSECDREDCRMKTNALLFVNHHCRLLFEKQKKPMVIDDVYWSVPLQPNRLFTSEKQIKIIIFLSIKSKSLLTWIVWRSNLNFSNNTSKLCFRWNFVWSFHLFSFFCVLFFRFAFFFLVLLA